MTSRFARAKGEEGATMVIVVLCLIAMFGMIVLVMDVGGLLLRRRALVNGADSAALAAAKSCVLPASQDLRTPEDAADEWALLNVEGATVGGTNILQISGCDAATGNGYVSVEYTAPQDLFFAPVLGYDDSATVASAATAIWGPPGRANPIPIVVYANSFNDCRLDNDPTPGAQCYLWEDNGNTQGPQSGFGTLDLRTDNPGAYGWDSDPGVTCPNAGNDPTQWIDNYPDPSVGELPLNYPAATYVCRLTGLQNPTWDALENLKDDDDSIDNDDEEDVLFFPVNRCYPAPSGSETDGQIDSGTDPVACGDTPHQYDIIGFVAFKLIEVYRPNEVTPTTTPCGPFSRAFPASSPLNLDTFGITQGCFASAPDSIVDASVSVRRTSGPASQRGIRGPNGTTCVGTTFDYCYDPATRTVLWNNAGPAPENQNYQVSFDWSNDGVCGIPPSGNNSGHCLVVEFVDIAIGGGGPGQGDPNSNIRAYKLCEPTVASTCAPINVPVP
jgi:hypothetical protein